MGDTMTTLADLYRRLGITHRHFIALLNYKNLCEKRVASFLKDHGVIVADGANWQELEFILIYHRQTIGLAQVERLIKKDEFRKYFRGQMRGLLSIKHGSSSRPAPPVPQRDYPKNRNDVVSDDHKNNAVFSPKLARRTSRSTSRQPRQRRAISQPPRAKVQVQAIQPTQHKPFIQPLPASPVKSPVSPTRAFTRMFRGNIGNPAHTFFNVDLSNCDNAMIKQFVRNIIHVIENFEGRNGTKSNAMRPKNALATKGIYRISGEKSKLDRLRSEIERYYRAHAENHTLRSLFPIREYNCREIHKVARGSL